MLIAPREYERGDLLLAGVVALVGVVLTVYRIRLWQSSPRRRTKSASLIRRSDSRA
jgi:hypothetical protein